MRRGSTDVRRRLLAARAQRVRPARDDKVVAAWNGLAITGLCDAGLRLGEPAYVDAAVAAGELLWRVHVVDGRLRRVSRDGVVGAPAGVLEDHGCVASGFLSLVQATGDAVWLDRADRAARRRRSSGSGPRTAASSTPRTTPRRWWPGPATPPTTPRRPASRRWCTRWSTRTRSPARAATVQVAEEALATVAPLAEQAPRFAGWSLAAAQTLVAGGPLEVAVVGPAGELRDALARRARQHPGAVVVEADGPRDDVPLLSGPYAARRSRPRRTSAEASSASGR